MGSDQEVNRCTLSESDFDRMSDAVIAAVHDGVPNGIYSIILLSNNNGRVSVRTNFPDDPRNVLAAIAMLREAADNLEKSHAGRATTGADRRDTDLHGQDIVVPDYGPADPEAD